MTERILHELNENTDIVSVINNIDRLTFDTADIYGKYGEVICKKMMDVVEKCRCCDRHQTDRCTVIDFDNNISSGSLEHTEICKTSNNTPNICNCPCRHIAREICYAKVHIQEEPYDDYYSEDDDHERSYVSNQRSYFD